MSLFNFGALNSFLGRGSASITVPTLDGAFRPNDVLESAAVFAEIPSADTLAFANGRFLLSAGNQVLELKENSAQAIATFDSAITAFAANDDSFAVGLESGEVVVVGGDHDGTRFTDAEGKSLKCPTALYFKGDRLIVADGSDRTAPDDWARDLLERNSRGRVISFDLASGQQNLLASGVAYANGLAETVAGGIVVSQSWRHCISPTNNLREDASLCHNLPGYPSRISAAPDGGYWLAIFGMRTQLIEFILRENKYRKEMLDNVPPEYWIAPSLVSREHFLDPMQQGAVKQLGIKKPWAPPRSYGLVAKLDRDFRPQYSLHSRVGGICHGVTSALEVDGTLYVVAKGAGQVLTIDLATVEKEIVQ